MLNYLQYINNLQLESKHKITVASQLDMAKKIAREQRLEHEKMVGRPRAKSFGGRPTTKQDRRDANREMRQY